MTTAASRPRLILASASPRRRDLLRQAGLEPDCIEPTHIDESEIPGELPGPLALRLAQEKAAAHAGAADGFVLAADTVVGVGRRVLPKTETEDEARRCLELMSGRSHRVYTGIAVKAPDGQLTSRLVETRVKFKRLSEPEILAYLASGEWQGKAGGYAIQGMAGGYIINLIGSFTGVVGLPLYETINLLTGAGFPVLTRQGEAESA
ncbi:MAG: septum formation protein Maf [Maricaulis sp.]|uniref:Maf family nucleotide pyrophosphatase n=1 Tax=Maricaulis sp. TaxID=1486257 RepID=UPI001AFEA4AB|nr:Maf family nucleotide pyrophosphatase [Maricaulis sp.]MBO6729152.1 septum formation protein Maf [Maricaulis sp.]MBO6848684.1 septum formation protein Maf [Maricaulis sp.]MBO6878636.1 septum formation protein Maf [Maricaulis sp.]